MSETMHSDIVDTGQEKKPEYLKDARTLLGYFMMGDEDQLHEYLNREIIRKYGSDSGSLSNIFRIVEKKMMGSQRDECTAGAWTLLQEVKSEYNLHYEVGNEK